MGLVTTLSIDIHINSIEFLYAECHYAQCRNYLNVMLSVVRLNVIMPRIKAPLKQGKWNEKPFFYLCFVTQGGLGKQSSLSHVAAAECFAKNVNWAIIVTSSLLLTRLFQLSLWRKRLYGHCALQKRSKFEIWFYFKFEL